MWGHDFEVYCLKKSSEDKCDLNTEFAYLRVKGEQWTDNELEVFVNDLRKFADDLESTLENNKPNSLCIRTNS